MDESVCSIIQNKSIFMRIEIGQKRWYRRLEKRYNFIPHQA